MSPARTAADSAAYVDSWQAARDAKEQQRRPVAEREFRRAAQVGEVVFTLDGGLLRRPVAGRLPPVGRPAR